MNGCPVLLTKQNGQGIVGTDIMQQGVPVKLTINAHAIIKKVNIDSLYDFV